MEQLYGNMYEAFGRGSGLKGLFGLQNGQYFHNKGTDDIAHNAGWLNSAGEVLGMGDLRALDVRRIAEEIADDELFIIVGEQTFTEIRYGKPDSGKSVRNIDCVGILATIESAWWIIAKGRFYAVSFFGEKKGKQMRGGIRFQVISRERARRMILASVKSKMQKISVNEKYMTKSQMGALIDCVGRRVELTYAFDGKKHEIAGILESVVPFETAIINGARLPLIGIFGLVERVMENGQLVFSNEEFLARHPKHAGPVPEWAKCM